jgi:phytoene dehydrogenase-like protein
MKVELFAKPSYFRAFTADKAAYRAEKQRIADQVISLLEKPFPGLRQDIEVIDVSTLQTWERYMGGSDGCHNTPFVASRNPMAGMIGMNKRYTLPGLKGFYFTGQWVTGAGALFMNALSGKTVIRKIKATSTKR